MPATSQNEPLKDIKLLITRAEHQCGPFAQKLTSLGARVTSHPMIRIGTAPNPEKVRDCLMRLEEFAMVVFLSQNAASVFANELSQHQQKQKMPLFGAIGSGTRSRLEESGHVVEFVPEQSNSESMAETLIKQYLAGGHSRPILIIRADRGSAVIPSALTESGISFVELPIYRSLDRPEADSSVLQDLADGQFDWITVTSSAIASNVARLFGNHLGSTKIASISPTTSAAAAEAGLTVSAEATTYSIDGLIEAVVRQVECERASE